MFLSTEIERILLRRLWNLGRVDIGSRRQYASSSIRSIHNLQREFLTPQPASIRLFPREVFQTERLL